MSTSLQSAEDTILRPAGLTEADITRALGQVLHHSVDAADLYFQTERHESWSLEDGIVKSAGFSLDRGVGVRAISGDKVGFAYSDDIIVDALTDAVQSARAIARAGVNATQKAWHTPPTKALYQPLDPLMSLEDEEKIALLQRADRAARDADPRVTQVMASLAGTYETVLITASDGTWATDVRPLVRLNVSVVVTSNGRREMAGHGGGARMGYEYFTGTCSPESYAKEAVRQALLNLDADPAPAGIMPVVLGAGWPGVMLHEAVGHGLEGDFTRKGTSIFSGRVGEQVTSSVCTVVDDGTIEDRRGSISIDDEGTPGQYNVLIEKGILRGFMQDKMNARLSGVAPTGNGRRQSYAHLTMPRMTNTYLLPGESKPEEIIASVDRGLYAVNFGGGQVDITSGKFVFSASEAYLIEKGKITRPVKGATLVGSGPDIMNKVSMVADDLALDGGVGTCGKEGQSVPVGVGQPTLKIDGITVGGTQV